MHYVKDFLLDLFGKQVLDVVWNNVIFQLGLRCHPGFKSWTFIIPYSVSNQSDCALLQNNLNSFVTWCHNNKLSLNVDKCSHVEQTWLARCEEFKQLVVIRILNLIKCCRVLFHTTAVILQYWNSLILFHAFIVSKLDYVLDCIFVH